MMTSGSGWRVRCKKNYKEMITEIQKRRCLNCGHEFTHTDGDFVLVLFPRCPKCGVFFTRKIRAMK